MDKGTKRIEDIVDKLRALDFQVVDVGARYRVTHPDGGRPVFMPKRLPKGKAGVSPILASLRSIGFDPREAEREIAARLEAERQRRLEAERAEAERLAALAEAHREEVTVPAQRTSVEVERGPRSEVMEITPEFAKELLAANRFYDPKKKTFGGERTNRPFSQAKAEQYRDAILQGRWKLTHQGVALDVHGELMDGQHRLAGLVMAGAVNPDISVKMMVTYDLEPDVVDVVDIGKKRTVGDVLAMYGESHSTLTGAVLKLIAFYDAQCKPGEWNNFSLTPEVAREMLAAEPEIREAVKFGNGWTFLAINSSIGASYHVISRTRPSQYERGQFFDSLRTGADLSLGDPVLTLRNVLLGQKTNAKRGRSALEQFSLVVKAWNAYVQGRPLRKLSWKVTEDVPRVVG